MLNEDLKNNHFKKNKKHLKYLEVGWGSLLPYV